MVFKVIIKSKGKTLVSDHRLKSSAIKFKELIARGKKRGVLPSITSIRLKKVK